MPAYKNLKVGITLDAENGKYFFLPRFSRFIKNLTPATPKQLYPDNHKVESKSRSSERLTITHGVCYNVPN